MALRKDGQHLAVQESDIRPASLCWAGDRSLLPNRWVILLLEGGHLLKGQQKPGVKDTRHSENHASTVLSASPGLKCTVSRLKLKLYQFLEESIDVGSSAMGSEVLPTGDQVQLVLQTLYISSFSLSGMTAFSSSPSVMYIHIYICTYSLPLKPLSAIPPQHNTVKPLSSN